MRFMHNAWHGMGRGRQAHFLAAGWWFGTADALWSHRLLLIGVSVGLAALRGLFVVITWAAPIVGSALAPHLFRFSDAIGERTLSRAALRMTDGHTDPNIGVRGDGMPLAQMQLDLTLPPRAYDRLAT